MLGINPVVNFLWDVGDSRFLDALQQRDGKSSSVESLLEQNIWAGSPFDRCDFFLVRGKFALSEIVVHRGHPGVAVADGVYAEGRWGPRRSLGCSGGKWSLESLINMFSLDPEIFMSLQFCLFTLIFTSFPIPRAQEMYKLHLAPICCMSVVHYHTPHYVHKKFEEL